MPTLTGFGSLKAIKTERITPKVTRRLLSGRRGMVVQWRVKAGAHAHAHKHPHEQIVWMVKGRMKFRIGRAIRVMRAGDVDVIPGGVEHEAWWPTDCEVIDFFAPPRRDFLTGRPPAYMRKG
jgi:quercetin dioxygenase-like cupin family protein